MLSIKLYSLLKLWRQLLWEFLFHKHQSAVTATSVGAVLGINFAFLKGIVGPAIVTVQRFFGRTTSKYIISLEVKRKFTMRPQPEFGEKKCKAQNVQTFYLVRNYIICEANKIFYSLCVLYRVYLYSRMFVRSTYLSDIISSAWHSNSWHSDSLL